MFFVIVFGVPWLLWKLLSSLRKCSYPPRVWYPVHAHAFVSGSYKARNMHLGIVHGSHTSLKRCNLHHIYYITVMVISSRGQIYSIHLGHVCGAASLQTESFFRESGSTIERSRSVLGKTEFVHMLLVISWSSLMVGV